MYSKRERDNILLFLSKAKSVPYTAEMYGISAVTLHKWKIKDEAEKRIHELINNGEFDLARSFLDENNKIFTKKELEQLLNYLSEEQSKPIQKEETKKPQVKKTKEFLPVVSQVIEQSEVITPISELVSELPEVVPATVIMPKVQSKAEDISSSDNIVESPKTVNVVISENIMFNRYVFQKVRAQLSREEDIPVIIEALKLHLKDNPNNTVAKYILVEAYFRLDATENALSVCNEIINCEGVSKEDLKLFKAMKELVRQQNTKNNIPGIKQKRLDAIARTVPIHAKKTDLV